MSESAEPQHFFTDVSFKYVYTNDGRKKLMKVTKKYKMIKKPKIKLLSVSSKETTNQGSHMTSSTKSESRHRKERENAQKFAKKHISNFLKTKSLPSPAEVASMSSLKAMENLCELLRYCYLPEFVLSHKFGLIEWLRNALRYPTNAGYELAIEMVPVMAAQLGPDESFFKAVCPLLNIRVRYGTAKSLRGLSCASLGVLRLLQNPDLKVLLDTMKMLEDIFADIYLCDDYEEQLKLNGESADLYTRAIIAWALMLSLLPPADQVVWKEDGKSFLPTLNSFLTLLDSTHVGVRIAAAETLALILECGRAYREKFWMHSVKMITKHVKRVRDQTSELCKKRYRELQMESLDGVLEYLQKGNVRFVNIKLGKETLKLDSWAKQFQYAAFVSTLKGGVKTHLRENYFLREIFDLSWDNMQENNSSTALQKICQLDEVEV